MVEITQRTDVPLFEDIRLDATQISVQKIEFQDLWQCLKLGVSDFGDKPSSALILLALYYPLSAVIFSLVAIDQQLRYLLFPLVAGFTFMGPLVAVVFFELSRMKQAGQVMRWRSAFRFIHTSSFAPMLALSIIMTVLYLVWLYLAEQIYFVQFGDVPLESLAGFFTQLTSTRAGWSVIVYGNLVGGLFAFAAMALSVISFPLVLDKPITSIDAANVSIRAFTSNFWVLALWGVMVVALLAIGAVFVLIGLAIVLPVLGHATWHLYQRIIK